MTGDEGYLVDVIVRRVGQDLEITRRRIRGGRPVIEHTTLKRGELPRDPTARRNYIEEVIRSS